MTRGHLKIVLPSSSNTKFEVKFASLNRYFAEIKAVVGCPRFILYRHSQSITYKLLIHVLTDY